MKMKSRVREGSEVGENGREEGREGEEREG